MRADESNGYEEIAPLYTSRRGRRPTVGDAIGAGVVRAWAERFAPNATVLDLGAGPGEPGTRILLEAGLTPFAIDASPTMVSAFRERFPGVAVEQGTAESSAYFGRSFDGVLAWGLLFLLGPDAQALVPGGRFLFTAPTQVHEWNDATTGRASRSLGAEAYARLLRDADLRWVDSARDEGENHYFFAEKATVGAVGS